MWATKLYSKAAGGNRAKVDLTFLGAAVFLISRCSGSEESEAEQTLGASQQPVCNLQRADHGKKFAVSLPLLQDNRTYCDQILPMPQNGRRIRRHQTMIKMESTATKANLRSKYDVEWKTPLGEGTFGGVYLGTNRLTGERVAVKKISKRITDNVAFQREMDALLHIREEGGHPNICGLQENFDEGKFYYLIIDLISGGEMFEQLCANGPYSEADAARLVKEIAGALAFLHGIGIIHGDLKPENIMLSSANTSDAVVKLVDFGCAQVTREDSPFYSRSKGANVANTPAYSAPEILKSKRKECVLDPSFDMWALGIIIYIMLTGVHPFDLYGTATNEEIEIAVVNKERPPLYNSPLTSHLSKDAIALIDQLIQWNPRRRLTAQQLLENPWVRGETARKKKIVNSHKKLSSYKAFTTKIGEKVFKDMLSMSANGDAMTDAVNRKSLLEHAFQTLDADHDGYLSAAELKKLSKEAPPAPPESGTDDQLTLSEFSELLADHMTDRYFPKGHIVYREGDVGHAMYFLNSGAVEVYTKDGFRKILRQPGYFFGEGALLHPKKTRSASIRCLSPVHVIEVSREYFDKYLAADLAMKLDLRVADKTRRRQRLKMILQLQKNLQERLYTKGENIFLAGENAKDLFILEEGKVDIQLKNQTVFSIGPGSMWGEHSMIFDRPRNVTSVCVSDSCRVQILKGRDFHKLLESHPSLKETMRDIALRREFQKALCAATNKSFPGTENELKATFDSLATPSSGAIEIDTVRRVIHVLDPTYTENEVGDILKAIDIADSGAIEWDEFKRLFDLHSES